MQYVPQTDWVIIVENGRIARQGTYSDLAEQGVDWSVYEIQHEDDEGNTEEGVVSRRASSDVKDVMSRTSSDMRDVGKRTSTDGNPILA